MMYIFPTCQSSFAFLLHSLAQESRHNRTAGIAVGVPYSITAKKIVVLCSAVTRHLLSSKVGTETITYQCTVTCGRVYGWAVGMMRPRSEAAAPRALPLVLEGMVKCYVPRPLAHSRLGPQESELSAHKLAQLELLSCTYSRTSYAGRPICG